MSHSTRNDRPLHISFLWHQHQPYYRTKDPQGKVIYQLPWVRLHAVKDYYDIPALLLSFPGIRQNFNLVPSLIAQIEDYVDNRATDHIIEMTLKDPAEMNESEREKVLDLFFMANYERMIEPYDRYNQLLRKKLTDTPLSHDDISDLQVWYNLCWVGESWKDKQPFRDLYAKGSGYTAEDKKNLIHGHYDIMSRVLPLYRTLMESGQIECSVTPYYHPILPLLCDSSVAGICDPEWIVPETQFRHPEDAEIQIRRAIDFFESRFHQKPRGMWPSEGSVSEEACALIREGGVEWIATDEGILDHSDTAHPEKNLLHPHRLVTGNGSLLMIFRDHSLSDAIGFQYSRIDPVAAADDFLKRIENIRRQILLKGRDPSEYLLPVILDGENCWEFYEQNGVPFLTRLYSLLTESSTVRTVTVSEFLRSRPAESFPVISRLHPGSWINHNFRIWIGGHPEENTAWTLLKKTRDWLAGQPEHPEIDRNILQQAWEEIYTAEGSDWFWWFGNDHWAHNKYHFDELFRYHLRKVYELLNAPVPPVLHQPIMITGMDTQAIRLPSGLITPKLDGRISHFYEWRLAGVYEAKRDSDTMAISDAWINRIFFGNDTDRFYLRVDFFDDKIDFFRKDPVYRLKVEFTEPRPAIWYFPDNPEADSAGSLPTAEWFFDEVFEMAVTLRDLQISSGDTLAFFVSVMEGDSEIVRRPSRNPIRMEVPDDQSDRYLWSV